MKKNPDIEARIDEVLDSVGNITRAEPNPFFFTRLEARMRKDDRSFWVRMSRMVTRPSIAFASVALVVLLNAFVVINGYPVSYDEPDMTEVASTEDLHSTSYYDIENIQP